MSPDESKKIRELVKDSIKEAVKEELGTYKVPKEEHYKDHVWLSELRLWQQTVKNSVIRSFIGVVILALASLIFYGFLFLGGGGK